MSSASKCSAPRKVGAYPLPPTMPSSSKRMGMQVNPVLPKYHLVDHRDPGAISSLPKNAKVSSLSSAQGKNRSSLTTRVNRKTGMKYGSLYEMARVHVSPSPLPPSSCSPKYKSAHTPPKNKKGENSSLFTPSTSFGISIPTSQEQGKLEPEYLLPPTASGRYLAYPLASGQVSRSSPMIANQQVNHSMPSSSITSSSHRINPSKKIERPVTIKRRLSRPRGTSSNSERKLSTVNPSPHSSRRSEVQCNGNVKRTASVPASRKRSGISFPKNESLNRKLLPKKIETSAAIPSPKRSLPNRVTEVGELKGKQCLDSEPERIRISRLSPHQPSHTSSAGLPLNRGSQMLSSKNSSRPNTAHGDQATTPHHRSHTTARNTSYDFFNTPYYYNAYYPPKRASVAEKNSKIKRDSGTIGGQSRNSSRLSGVRRAPANYKKVAEAPAVYVETDIVCGRGMDHGAGKHGFASPYSNIRGRDGYIDVQRQPGKLLFRPLTQDAQNLLQRPGIGGVRKKSNSFALPGKDTSIPHAQGNAKYRKSSSYFWKPIQVVEVADKTLGSDKYIKPPIDQAGVNPDWNTLDSNEMNSDLPVSFSLSSFLVSLERMDSLKKTNGNSSQKNDTVSTRTTSPIPQNPW